MSLSSPYEGTDKVTVGDGKSLPISHIGVGHLQTQSNSQLVLSLPHILHVPHMKKSLLNVSQLTRDNNVVVGFNSTSCLIKDKDSGLVLFRGTLRDGLYQLVSAFDSTVSNSSQTITPFKTSELVSLFSNKS